jgi:hypothetical protein
VAQLLHVFINQGIGPKVRGKMFVCIASHRSAEPNTLVVMMDFADRDALIEDDPGTYYLSRPPCSGMVTDRPSACVHGGRCERRPERTNLDDV